MSKIIIIAFVLTGVCFGAEIKFSAGQYKDFKLFIQQEEGKVWEKQEKLTALKKRNSILFPRFDQAPADYVLHISTFALLGLSLTIVANFFCDQECALEVSPINSISLWYMILNKGFNRYYEKKEREYRTHLQRVQWYKAIAEKHITFIELPNSQYAIAKVE